MIKEYGRMWQNKSFNPYLRTLLNHLVSSLVGYPITRQTHLSSASVTQIVVLSKAQIVY